MNCRLYVIYDKLAEDSGPIFQAVNDGVALRQTVNILKDVPPYVHHEYQLIHLADFDTSTMKLTCVVPKEIDFTLALSRSREYAAMEVEK